jgi:HEAT repeat protein
MTPGANAQGRALAARDMSPNAVAVAAWFRQLARALKVFRLYHSGNPLVVQMQNSLETALESLLKEHGALELRFTATEIYSHDELIVRAGQHEGDDALGAAAVDQLPFLFYRDGVRRMFIAPGVPRSEVEVLFEALKVAGSGPLASDDLVTLLWQANLTHIQVDSVPYEQTIYLSTRYGGGGNGGGARTQTFATRPGGEEIHAELGQAIGAQGLHKDTFDDWELPVGPIDVPEAYEKLLPSADRFREYLVAEWVAEVSIPWTTHVPEMLEKILRHVPGEEGRFAVAHAVATWFATSIESGAWQEAQTALVLLRKVDPDLALAGGEIEASLDGLDKVAIVERLDEGSGNDLARFTPLMVGLGPPAVDLLCSVLGHASRSRTRAAATAALSFVCADNPELLAPYLDDSRWFLVRNLVFVLGQIGGPQVTGLLEAAALHPEPRVRRQVVQGLGNVPRLERIPILLAQLDTQDGQLLAAALQLLTRERDPLVARAILDQITAPDFEARSESSRRAMFTALAEVADDASVPALEAVLHRGGWFARRTLERTAAARTLQRIGSERALAALEAGLRARSEAVRAACLDAMSSKGPA